MKKLMILRGVGIICALLLAYWLLFILIEDLRREAFQDWLMMDNTMWYNRPDFGPIGSALGAGFIVLMLVGLAWGFTMPKKD